MVLQSPEIPTGTHLLKTVRDTGEAKASLCVQLNNSDNNEAKNQNRIKKQKQKQKQKKPYRTLSLCFISCHRRLTRQGCGQGGTALEFVLPEVKR